MTLHSPEQRARRIVVVGGGFAGACVCVQLVRRSSEALAITLIDPAERPGPGLAYSATDPDHRLNGLPYVHSLIPDDVGHFSRWCQAQDILASDPQALCADGRLFPRRADYGRYLAQTLQAHSHWPATGSTITHLRDRAIGLSRPGAPLGVNTAAGQRLPAEQVFVATGNPLPRLPPPFDPALAQHPAVIENALDTQRLLDIAPDARVLLVGTGLTALDVLSTLLRRGHHGTITAVSRRGLRPRPQGPVPALLVPAQGIGGAGALPGDVMLQRLASAGPAFLDASVVPLEVRHWVAALRREIVRVQAAGGSWYQPFDELRDAVWRLWPTLPAPQKQRFLKRLRTWYDVHRFRAPPQNDVLVDAAVAEGRIRFLAARVHAVAVAADGHQIELALAAPGEAGLRRQACDVVVNCTGLDAAAGLAANPLLSALHQAGWIRRDAAGIGFDVDAQCRAVGADGRVHPALRLLGLPTAGHFGDPLGAMYIAAQIHRMLPDALRSLGQTSAETV